MHAHADTSKEWKSGYKTARKCTMLRITTGLIMTPPPGSHENILVLCALSIQKFKTATSLAWMTKGNFFFFFFNFTILIEDDYVFKIKASNKCVHT